MEEFALSSTRIDRRDVLNREDGQLTYDEVAFTDPTNKTYPIEAPECA